MVRNKLCFKKNGKARYPEPQRLSPPDSGTIVARALPMKKRETNEFHVLDARVNGDCSIRQGILSPTAAATETFKSPTWSLFDLVAKTLNRFTSALIRKYLVLFLVLSELSKS
jgi:hypothetical protein